MQLEIKTRIEDRFRDIEKAERDAARGNFFGASAKVMREAKQSLERVASAEPSPEGEPPHTHVGVFLRRAIRFHADKSGGIIGPLASIVGDVGSIHEFGKRRDEAKFPPRPFMRPALERSVDRIPKQWSGTIGG